MNGFLDKTQNQRIGGTLKHFLDTHIEKSLLLEAFDNNGDGNFQ